jgi:hypothetical protein
MRRVVTKTLVFIGYFLATFFLVKFDSFKLTAGWGISFFIDLIFWLSGALLGAHFLKIDQLFYVYFTKPEEPLSLEVKQLISQKRIGLAWDVLEQKESAQPHLAIRSFLFQLAWVVLGFFAISSTASFFGKALVLGIGLKLLLEEWDDILSGRSISWLFWQVKREVSLKEQKTYLWIMTGLFALLTLLLM